MFYKFYDYQSDVISIPIPINQEDIEEWLAICDNVEVLRFLCSIIKNRIYQLETGAKNNE